LKPGKGIHAFIIHTKDEGNARCKDNPKKGTKIKMMIITIIT